VLYYNNMWIRAFVAALALSWCLPAAAQNKLRTVATFSILGNLVAEVAGDMAEVAVLVGADIDAHTYQPKPAYW
jgi:zinc/manganese transport system substrate-binding protein